MQNPRENLEKSTETTSMTMIYGVPVASALNGIRTHTTVK